MAHSRAVRVLANQLGGDLEAEALVGDASGLQGRVDLLQSSEAGVSVHEVKTGRSSRADVIQLMLYMALLKERRRLVVGGVLHRPDGQVSVATSDIPDKLLRDAREVAATLASDTQPPKVQEMGCAWCRADCAFAAGTEGGG